MRQNHQQGRQFLELHRNKEIAKHPFLLSKKDKLKCHLCNCDRMTGYISSRLESHQNLPAIVYSMYVNLFVLKECLLKQKSFFVFQDGLMFRCSSWSQFKDWKNSRLLIQGYYWLFQVSSLLTLFTFNNFVLFK